MRNRPSILPRRKSRGRPHHQHESCGGSSWGKGGGEIWFKESSHRLEGVLIWELDGRHFSYFFFPSLNISLRVICLFPPSLVVFDCRDEPYTHKDKLPFFFFFLCVCVCSISLRRRNPFGKKNRSSSFLIVFFFFLFLTAPSVSATLGPGQVINSLWPWFHIVAVSKCRHNPWARSLR